MQRSGTPEEVNEVGAAAQEHVLAVVDLFRFTGREEGRCSAAEDGAFFQEFNLEAGVSEANGGGQTGQSSTNNDYPWNRRHPGSSPALLRSLIFAA